MSQLLVVCASHAPGMARDSRGLLGTSFRAGMTVIQDRVAIFDPELVVVFGGDHRRAFREVTPAFTIVQSGELLADAGHPGSPLAIPTALARGLTEHLLSRDFDVAAGRNLQLDHAFSQPLQQLAGLGVRAEPLPVLPVPVNCAAPPLPSARRVLEFGATVGEFLADLDQRVLVIGTGGLSHHPASLDNDRYDLTDTERRDLNVGHAEQSRARINPVWDQAFLTAMAARDTSTLLAMASNCEVDAGVGAHEVRTWLAAAATNLDDPASALQAVAYEPVPEWITGMGAMVSR